MKLKNPHATAIMGREDTGPIVTPAPLRAGESHMALNAYCVGEKDGF
jgi:hypothetical protein